MNVENMTNSNGNKVANQFIITDDFGFTNAEGQKKTGIKTVFQSYESVIIEVLTMGWDTRTSLDRDKWDYSTTTGKYRNIFLGETKKETEKKIKSGEYILADLN